MIHKFKLNNNNIVIDVNSGAIHILDDCAYDLLDELDESIDKSLPVSVFQKLLSKYSENDLNEAHAELLSLYEQKLLFSDEINIDYTNILAEARLKSLCLNVAHDCNLYCEYCFASKGDFGSERMLMPFEIAKRAIDLLIKESANRHNLEVDFFGGEPLMNFDVVTQTVMYARSLEKKYNKNFRFTITTNGILLDDEKIDFINREMSNVVLSIDGRKIINDRFRPTRNNTGSYDIIVPKFKKLVEKRTNKDYYVRGTFTKYNLDFTKDVLLLADLGFKHISLEPVVSDPELDYSITEKELPDIFKEYENLALKIIEKRKLGKNFNFFHFMLDLSQGPCVIKRIKGCGCGNEYMAIAPDGSIYPCHQFVGDKNFIIGSLNDLHLNKKLRESFSQVSIFTKPDCKKCWAKFYCSGGCVANSYKYQHNLYSSDFIYCSLQKKRIECAIMLLSELNKLNSKGDYIQ